MRAGLLVIGFGNPLRSDDGLGWRAAERLAETLTGAEVVTTHQLVPELAETLSQCTRAVFIDAADPAASDAAPGTVLVQALAPRAPEPSAFSHHLDPAGLLAMAQALYGYAPKAQLITVVGASFDFGEQLSPSVQAALEAVVRLVKSDE